MTVTNTPADSIRYAWRRAVVRDYRLTEADRRVLLELESYADPDGTNARPGVDRIASHLRTAEDKGLSEKTVRRGLARGRELGYLEQTAKARRAGDRWLAAVYRLTMPLSDAAGSPDTQMSDGLDGAAEMTGHSAAITGHWGGGSPDTQMSAHQSLNHQSISRDEKTSVGAGAQTPAPVDRSINGEATTEPLPLHPEWTPNNANRAVAAELGLDVEVAAEVFRQGMTELGERRREWGKAFTAYLRDEAAGVAAETFAAVDEDDMATQAVDTAVEALKAQHEAEAEAWFAKLDAAIRAHFGAEYGVHALSDEGRATLDKRRAQGWSVEDALAKLQAKPVEAPAVEEIASVVAEAPVVKLGGRNTYAAMQWLDRALVGGLRGEDRVEAERMLEAGERRDTVKAAMLARQKARKARMRAELDAARPASIPA